jgi:putative FmdB family regulatory protein
MPVYDYVCGACGNLLEVIHGIYAEGPRFCPACGAEGRMTKALSAPAVVFKGSGWAKKDRRVTASSTSRSDSKSSDSKSSDSKSSDSKSGGSDTSGSTSKGESSGSATSSGSGSASGSGSGAAASSGGGD